MLKRIGPLILVPAILLLIATVAISRWPAAQPLGLQTISTQKSGVHSGPLFCPHATWDFGTVDSIGSPIIEHKFVIENTSSCDVQISGIHATCGCVVIDPPPKSVPASGGVELPVRVSLPPYSQFVQQSIAISQEGVDDALILDIVGNRSPKAEIVSYPSMLNFGTISSDTSITRKVRIKQSTGALIGDVVKLKKRTGIDATVERLSPNELALTVTFHPTQAFGGTNTFRDDLRLTFDQKDGAELLLEVLARRDGKM